MTVLFLQKPSGVWNEELPRLRSHYPNVTFTHDENPDPETLKSVEVIVSPRISQEIVDAAPNLKAILLPMTGITHFPLETIKARGIRLGNSHGNSAGVAERAVAMILAFSGKIIEYHNDLKEHRWHGFWIGRGLDDTWECIQEKRVAMIGAGEIGHFAARYLKAFDCTITGFKRTPVKELPRYYDRMVYDIDEAIDGAEIVVVTLPSTEETRGLIDSARLERMHGALLVNVGRGDVIDEEALFNACRDGVLRGAAIDTWYDYPQGSPTGAPSRFPFETLPNVLLSPHTAGFTRLSAERCARETAENLRAWLERGELVSEADPHTAY